MMQIANLKYADPTNTLIDMDVTLDGGDTVPFTYDPNDPAPVSCAVRGLLANGSHAIAAYEAPPALPAAVPVQVTRKQMLIGLVRAGYITYEEAIAAGGGAVPADIEAVYDTLPTQQARDEAAIEWANMLWCERNHPIVAMLQASKGLTDAQVDDLFREWAAL